MKFGQKPADPFGPGQLFMIGLPGPRLDDSTLTLIREFRINKFIYFKRNVADRQQLRQLTRDLKKACKENGLGVPLVAIDQEGGTVTRLPPPFIQFPDARVMAESAEPEKAVVAYASSCAAELKSIGVNYNLAPVLDVCETGKEYFMEKRALGSDPGKVARLGCLIINEMQKKGIAASAKHFPGLGSAVVDPHFVLPLVQKTETEIRRHDLVPFQMAIEAKVATIMTSHTIYRHLDPENPATLSEKILTQLLRKELRFEGVIITDDLEMGAIEKQQDIGTAALQAFRAGSDLLLICHSHDKIIKAVAQLAAAVEKDSLLKARMTDSIRRLRVMQQQYAADN